jgi:hypothetical protein
MHSLLSPLPYLAVVLTRQIDEERCVLCLSIFLQCERAADVHPNLEHYTVPDTVTTLCNCIPVQACPGGVSGAPVPFTVLQESVGLPEDILKRVIHSLACGTLHVVL